MQCSHALGKDYCLIGDGKQWVILKQTSNSPCVKITAPMRLLLPKHYFHPLPKHFVSKKLWIWMLYLNKVTLPIGGGGGGGGVQFQ